MANYDYYVETFGDLSKAEESKEPAVAIELADGRIVTGRTS